MEIVSAPGHCEVSAWNPETAMRMAIAVVENGRADEPDIPPQADRLW